MGGMDFSFSVVVRRRGQVVGSVTIRHGGVRSAGWVPPAVVAEVLVRWCRDQRPSGQAGCEGADYTWEESPFDPGPN